LHVRCERRLSKSVLRTLSCCAVSAGHSLFPCVSGRTSSASSGFLGIFCFRLSLLAGRVAALSSTSFDADRLAPGVLPRTVREAGAILDCCELEAPWVVEEMEDDEFLGRAVAGGVDRCWRLSMTAR
jgi:hypothetical protein